MTEQTKKIRGEIRIDKDTVDALQKEISNIPALKKKIEEFPHLSFCRYGILIKNNILHEFKIDSSE